MYSNEAHNIERSNESQDQEVLPHLRHFQGTMERQEFEGACEESRVTSLQAASHRSPSSNQRSSSEFPYTHGSTRRHDLNLFQLGSQGEHLIELLSGKRTEKVECVKEIESALIRTPIIRAAASYCHGRLRTMES